jgi:hypothetical protein
MSKVAKIAKQAKAPVATKPTPGAKSVAKAPAKQAQAVKPTESKTESKTASKAVKPTAKAEETKATKNSKTGSSLGSGGRVTKQFTESPKEMVDRTPEEINEYLISKLEQKFKMSLEEFCRKDLSMEHFGIKGATFRLQLVSQVNINTMQAVADKLKLGNIRRKMVTTRVPKYTIV